MTANQKLFLRLLWVPCGAVFLFSLLAVNTRSLNSILYSLTEDGYAFYLTFEAREQLVVVLFATVVTAHLFMEVAARFRPDISRSRTLMHLRWGPAAVTAMWIATVLAFDAAMIEVSRLRIRNYVYSGSPLVEKPDLGTLHVNHRGSCGNGISAAYENLYYPAASSGLRDADPAVRARSFLASVEVGDILNGSPRFRDDLKVVCTDESDLVRRTVDERFAERGFSCDKYVFNPKKVSLPW